MFNLNQAIKTIATYAAATTQAIAIMTLAPKSIRDREVSTAKRNIAARKAKAVRINQEVTKELLELKSIIVATPVTPKPAKPSPAPVNDPWLEPLSITPKPTTHQWRSPQQPPTLKLLSPAKPTGTSASSPTAAKPNYSKLTIRELKAIASNIKLKGYARMNKAQLAQALSQG